MKAQAKLLFVKGEELPHSVWGKRFRRNFIPRQKERWCVWL